MAKALGDSVVVEAPKVEQKPLQHTIGIRSWIPSKTIGPSITKFLDQTKAKLLAAGIADFGQPFFRFHCINMGTEFEIEVGYLTASALPPIAGLVTNSFPAARYTTLKYAGKNRGYQGNKALIEWTRANGYEMDRWDTERGDTFACRFEIYISDIDKVPDHKDWIKEIAIKLK